MKVKINIENENVKFCNQELDFSKYGIYFISGENGVGKTTIIRNIVLGQEKVFFQTKEAEKVNKKERQKLITYIEQDPKPASGNVKEYIYRCNSNVNKEKMKEYLKLFQLDSLDWKQKVERLSGGERIKLNIIAGLLKETPYIFLDEPTNNMDNESVAIFVKIVNAMKDKHTIIIISHDPRLNIDTATHINILKERIVYEDKGNGELNKEICPVIRKAKWNRFLLHIRDPIVLSSMILIFFFQIILGVANTIVVSGWYNTEELPNLKDVISAYIVDGVYGELNETYAKSEHLKIMERNFYNLISYDDLENIAADDKVAKILASDEKYLYNMADDFYEGKMLDNLHIASIPYDVVMEFGDTVNYCVDIRYLEKGRLPYDNKHEVAISRDLLSKYFGVGHEEQAIGQSIELEGEKYEVVGICYENICVISYTGKDDYGFLLYDKENFYRRKEELKQYLESIDATNINTPSMVVIYTKEGCEKKALNKLIEKYSANNYYSHEFAKSFAKQYNFGVNIMLILGNVLFSIAISTLMTIIHRKSNELYKGYMETLDYYYLSTNETKRIFILARLLEYLIGVCLVLLLIQKISEYEMLVYRYFFIDCAILLIPLLMLYRKGKENDY